MALDRLQILSKKDSLPRQEIVIPEWEGSVWVRSLTVGERDSIDSDFNAARTKGKTPDNLRARMLIKGCCNADGSALFSESDIADVNKLPATILEKIFDAILKINRIGAGAVEDAEKN
jgi:hypothetical protein